MPLAAMPDNEQLTSPLTRISRDQCREGTDDSLLSILSMKDAPAGNRYICQYRAYEVTSFRTMSARRLINFRRSTDLTRVSRKTGQAVTNQLTQA
jgi:hypothetical protein